MSSVEGVRPPIAQNQIASPVTVGAPRVENGLSIHNRAYALLERHPFIAKWASLRAELDGAIHSYGKLIQVAKHEFCHALVAMKGYHITPESISVIPKGPVLGVTRFPTDITEAAILGAGHYATGSWGTGGDEYHVTFTLGASWAQAKSDAHAILSKIDDEVLSIGSRLIAARGYVTDVAGLVAYAELETAWNEAENVPLWEVIGQITNAFAEEFVGPVEPAIVVEEPMQNGWEYRTYEGYEDTVLILNGQEYKKRRRYLCCGGLDAHASGCDEEKGQI